MFSSLITVKEYHYRASTGKVSWKVTFSVHIHIVSNFAYFFFHKTFLETINAVAKKVQIYFLVDIFQTNSFQMNNLKGFFDILKEFSIKHTPPK